MRLKLKLSLAFAGLQTGLKLKLSLAFAGLQMRMYGYIRGSWRVPFLINHYTQMQAQYIFTQAQNNNMIYNDIWARFDA